MKFIVDPASNREENFTKFIPQTQTVNMDREYYVNKNYFIKIDYDIKRGFNEAYFLRQLSHKSIPVYYNSYIKNNKHILCMSNVQGKTLENLSLSFTTLKQKIIPGIYEILAYLSKKQIVHGDINESNILFNEENIYLIDWEKAKVSTSFLDDIEGTRGLLYLLNLYQR